MTRAVTFWNDETIQFIREHFVAASVPTWVCRSDGPEGEFLRGAGIHKQWVTSSGYMSCVSASGKPLGRRPNAEVLAAFASLPETERLPGVVQVLDLPAGQQTIPPPPEGGMVLRVHARFLARDNADLGRESVEGLRRATGDDFPLMQEKPRASRGWGTFLQPNTEYMWLTRDERRSLIPKNPQPEQRIPVNRAIVERMARFHLTPQRATTSEGGVRSRRALKQARMTLLVDKVSSQRITMTVEGFVHWGSDFDPAKATSPDGSLPQGFETALYGRIVYDRTRQEFSRFDLLAPGEVWGRWGDANRKSMVVERPGRSPFGFVFELASGHSPTDQLPPGGNAKFVERAGYFAPD